MSPSPLNQAAQAILTRYGLSRAGLQELGNHGGFSGARLWRVEAGEGIFCLRSWPPGDPTSERLGWLHGLMARARAAGLTFVPHVLPAGSGTFTLAADRLWELTAWLPGEADFHQQPRPARLRAAVAALAELHRTWARIHPSQGPCPALARRQRAAEAWLGLVATGWRPCFPNQDRDPVQSWAERAWSLAATWVPRVPALLAPWVDRPLPLHPCLCDIWHDHLLFDGDAVLGIVDYGSMKIDHAAVDLARLLGSLVPDDDAGWDTALAAYAALRPFTADERALARIMDRTGTIVAIVNWLRWLYHDGRHFDDRQLVAGRLAGLVQRIEGWRL